MKDNKSRFVRGLPAVALPNGGWQTPDGRVWFFCASSHCPALPYQASKTYHPSSCLEPRNDCKNG